VTGVMIVSLGTMADCQAFSTHSVPRNHRGASP
jgi:hypothetical protein